MTNKRKAIVFTMIFIIALMVASIVDTRVFQIMQSHDSSEQDWHRMFRICGYLPIWLVVGTAMMLHQRHRITGKLKRHIGTILPAGLILIINVVSCAVLGELLKLVIRREKPDSHHGLYFFRPYTDKTWSTGGLGLPSSHAMVAFASVWILCRLYPKAWPVWLTLGLGCAFVRVANHSHFTSDVVASIAISYCMTAILWQFFTHKPASALDKLHVSNKPI